MNIEARLKKIVDDQNVQINVQINPNDKKFNRYVENRERNKKSQLKNDVDYKFKYDFQTLMVNGKRGHPTCNPTQMVSQVLMNYLGAYDNSNRVFHKASCEYTYKIMSKLILLIVCTRFDQ